MNSFGIGKHMYTEQLRWNAQTTKHILQILIMDIL